jgi:hypothetical protein
VPEIIDPVFAKTSQNARFLLSENERFGLVFVKTGSINSGTEVLSPETDLRPCPSSMQSHFFASVYHSTDDRMLLVRRKPPLDSLAITREIHITGTERRPQASNLSNT